MGADGGNKNLWMSLRNVPHVECMPVAEFNPFHLLHRAKVVFTKAGWDLMWTRCAEIVKPEKVKEPPRTWVEGRTRGARRAKEEAKLKEAGITKEIGKSKDAGKPKVAGQAKEVRPPKEARKPQEAGQAPEGSK